MIYESIYKKLTSMIDIEDLKRKEALKYERNEFMDLNIDYLRQDDQGNQYIAIAHNYLLNGDVMCDPDMEIKIVPSMEMAEA